MWVYQRVSHRVYWHSVHLQLPPSLKGNELKDPINPSSSPSISLCLFESFVFSLVNGGGHPVNQAMFAILCKTHVKISHILIIIITKIHSHVKEVLIITLASQVWGDLEVFT